MTRSPAVTPIMRDFSRFEGEDLADIIWTTENAIGPAASTLERCIRDVRVDDW